MNNLIEFPTKINENRIFELAKQFHVDYPYLDVKPEQWMLDKARKMEEDLIKSHGAIYKPYIMLNIKKDYYNIV